MKKRRVNKRSDCLYIFFKDLVINKQLYLMTLPTVCLMTVFAYMPMAGIIIAFKKFKFNKGIFRSEWMDPIFKNFEILVSSSDSIRAVRNTFLLNTLFIITITICAVVLAIMLNEIRHNKFKKITQSLTFLPFFMSWIVIGQFAVTILSYNNGIINNFLVALGMKERISFYSKPEFWPAILAIVNIWKGVGYAAVVYLATLSSIDISYYEAAEIDGASRLQMIRYISIPMLRPAISILVLLAIGNIMRADFGMFFFVTHDISMLYPTSDVIDTFIFRGLRRTGNIGISSAAGFFQSVISFFLVIVSNHLVKKFDKDSALF